MYTLDDALEFDISKVYDLYRRYSNSHLPDLYKKFSFGQSVIKKADGSYLFTSDGKKIFDMTGGLGVANFGHNNERILRVREKYVASGRPEIHKSYFNPVLAAASSNLASVVGGGLNYSFFCNSGAEAVDGALKLAYKKYNGERKIVLHSDRSFHGKTLGAGSISAGDNFVGGNGRFFFQKIPGVMTYNFSNIDSIKSILRSVGEKNVYAIFVEPFSCSTLAESTEQFLIELKKITVDSNISLVFDEIYSGFGKCGYDFYFHKYNVSPDVLCLSKALGGGKSSISAYITTPEMYEAAYGSISGALTHSTTYNSFGEECATALEACNILIEEKVSENAKELEKVMKLTFEKWIKNPASPVLDFRGSGSHFGLVFKDPFKLLKPYLKLIPIDFVSDPLFTTKLFVTSLANSIWEDASSLCAFTSNQQVILNISPSPLANVLEFKSYLDRIESVLNQPVFNHLSKIIKNSRVSI